MSNEKYQEIIVDIVWSINSKTLLVKIYTYVKHIVE